jgi:hypothetical protein
MTSTTTTATVARMQKIGQIVELAGIAAFVVGMILSVHHYAIGAFFVGGAAAYVIGKELHG